MGAKAPKRPRRVSEGEEALALQLRAVGIGFMREVQIHPDRKWRADFAVGLEGAVVTWGTPTCALVEVEGGHWSGGRHVRGKGYEADLEKYNEAALLGWRVLRVTTGMVRSGEALALIERALGKAKAPA